MINVTELEHALRQGGFDVQAEELQGLMKNLDYAGNGRINYSEFLAATVSIK